MTMRLESSLLFLEFDASEDDQGHCSFDAMASAAPAQLAALQAEVVRVLDWARARFGAPAPLEEGGEWDLELQGVRELATTLRVRQVPGLGLELQDEGTAAPRITLSITLTGTAAFGDAFRAAFGVD
jgi:hypothetical protein